MFARKTLISGILLAASTLASPASATHANMSASLDRLLFDDSNAIYQPVRHVRRYGDWDRGYDNEYDRNRKWRRDRRRNDYEPVKTVDPIRRMKRQLRRRGLYPINDYRIRKGRIIQWAENDRGARFRIVASARTGTILKIVRRGEVRRPYIKPTYDWQPTYDGDWWSERSRRRDRRIERPKRERKNLRVERPKRERKDRRVERSRRERIDQRAERLKRERKNRRVERSRRERIDQRAERLKRERKNRRTEAQKRERKIKNNRRNKVKREANRVRRETNRKRKLPYIDRTPEQEELYLYGSGR